MYHTALKMASQIAEPETRSPNAYALMIAAGHMRMDAARKGPEGKSSALAGKVKLRCEQVDMQVASFTPLMGKYAYLWNVTLNRRLEEGRALAVGLVAGDAARVEEGLDLGGVAGLEVVFGRAGVAHGEARVGGGEGARVGTAELDERRIAGGEEEEAGEEERGAHGLGAVSRAV